MMRFGGIAAVLLVLMGCGSSGNRSDGGVAGDGGTADGGTLFGTLRFGIKLLPDGAAAPLDCTATSLTNLQYEVFDVAHQNVLQTQVTRPCVANEIQTVTLAAGPYLLRIQGLNAGFSTCYQSDLSVTVQAGQTSSITAVVQQNPGGAGAGCTYP
jgi:hypothetical protein